MIFHLFHNHLFFKSDPLKSDFKLLDHCYPKIYYNIFEQMNVLIENKHIVLNIPKKYKAMFKTIKWVQWENKYHFYENIFDKYCFTPLRGLAASKWIMFSMYPDLIYQDNLIVADQTFLSCYEERKQKERLNFPLSFHWLTFLLEERVLAHNI